MAPLPAGAAEDEGEEAGVRRAYSCTCCGAGCGCWRGWWPLRLHASLARAGSSYSSSEEDQAPPTRDQGGLVRHCSERQASLPLLGPRVSFSFSSLMIMALLQCQCQAPQQQQEEAFIHAALCHFATVRVLLLLAHSWHEHCIAQSQSPAGPRATEIRFLIQHAILAE